MILERYNYRYALVPHSVAERLGLGFRPSDPDGNCMLNQSEVMSLEGDTFEEKVRLAGGIVVGPEEARYYTATTDMRAYDEKRNEPPKDGDITTPAEPDKDADNGNSGEGADTDKDTDKDTDSSGETDNGTDNGGTTDNGEDLENGGEDLDNKGETETDKDNSGEDAGNGDEGGQTETDNGEKPENTETESNGSTEADETTGNGDDEPKTEGSVSGSEDPDGEVREKGTKKTKTQKRKTMK